MADESGHGYSRLKEGFGRYKQKMTEPLAWFALDSEDHLEVFKKLVGEYVGCGTDTRTGTFEAFATFSSKKTMDTCAKKLRHLGIGDLVGFVF